jgi:AraC-like DNA-binding protein
MEFVHMTKFEKNLLNGAEWLVKGPLWVVVQLCGGVAYMLGAQTKHEMVLSGLAVVPPNSSVTIRSSILTEADLRGCSVDVSSLCGLITLGERMCLEKEAALQCAPFRLVACSHPLSGRLEQCFQNHKELNLLIRLAFLQSLAEWLAPFLEKAAVWNSERAETNPRERLKQFIHQTPESEMAGLNLEDLAKNLCCGGRHASRLFHEVCGCSFRKYISDLRLNKACQLLTQGNYKIIDVALESGHSSLALFNYNFKNRFRITPTEWRERYLAKGARSAKASRQLPTLPGPDRLTISLRAEVRQPAQAYER